MNRIKTIATAATTIAACAGVVLVGAPAQAATPASATFHGSCKTWSVTFAAGDTAQRFDVEASTLGTVISETLQPGDVDTFSGSFAKDGKTKYAIVHADGVYVAGQFFTCGSTAKRHHR